MRRLLPVVPLLLACGGGSKPDSGPDPTAEKHEAITRAVPAIDLPTAADAQAFQREYDDELRAGETTALTAVDANYVNEGQVLQLGLDGRRPIRNPVGDSLATFALRDGTFLCEQGCGQGPTKIIEPTTYSLGPLIIVASSQAGPGRVMLHDPQAEARTKFQGLPWFPIDASLIVAAGIERETGEATARLTTSRGLTKELPVFGRFFFDYQGKRSELVGYSQGVSGNVEAVLIPFTDETSGETTYPVGRYLNVDVPAGASAVSLDFNRATNPLCAYSPHYNCPIPPTGNALAFEVKAGEKYEKH